MWPMNGYITSDFKWQNDIEAQFSYLKHSLLKSQTSENVAHIIAILAQLSNISASENFLFCT